MGSGQFGESALVCGVRARGWVSRDLGKGSGWDERHSLGVQLDGRAELGLLQDPTALVRLAQSLAGPHILGQDALPRLSVLLARISLLLSIPRAFELEDGDEAEIGPSSLASSMYPSSQVSHSHLHSHSHSQSQKRSSNGSGSSPTAPRCCRSRSRSCS